MPSSSRRRMLTALLQSLALRKEGTSSVRRSPRRRLLESLAVPSAVAVVRLLATSKAVISVSSGRGREVLLCAAGWVLLLLRLTFIDAEATALMMLALLALTTAFLLVFVLLLLLNRPAAAAAGLPCREPRGNDVDDDDDCEEG